MYLHPHSSTLRFPPSTPSVLKATGLMPYALPRGTPVDHTALQPSTRAHASLSLAVITHVPMAATVNIELLGQGLSTFSSSRP